MHSLKHIFQTPVLWIGGLCLKLELFNIGGSHKARAARWMVSRAIEEGRLIPGGKQTILEKTGGNLGIGLAIEAAKWGVGVELAVGLNFSARKKWLLTRYGASLIGTEMIRNGAMAREVVAFHLDNQDKIGKSYVFLDQFSDLANVDAHLLETGPEIVQEVERQGLGRDKIALVGGVGSGASVSGVGLALKTAFSEVEVIAVQPEGCDVEREVFVEHGIQGIAVGVKPEILRSDIIDQYRSCSESNALAAREWLLNKTGIFAGLSTGANIHIAREILRENFDRKVFTFVYDSGESYE